MQKGKKRLDKWQKLSYGVQERTIKLTTPQRGPELLNPVEKLARDGTGKQGIEKLT